MKPGLRYRLSRVRNRGLLALLALGVVVTACDMVQDGGYLAEARSDCRVARVIDGDTVDLFCPGEPRERTRLVGFDTPEKVEPGCEAERQRALLAEAYLRGLIAGAAEIEVRRLGFDRYNRRLAVLTVDGDDLAERMIAAGHARAYSGGPRAGWCV